MTRRFLSLLMTCLLTLLVSPPVQARQDATTSTGLNVQNADIRAFIQDVGRATGLTFVVDPRVQGTVSVSRDQAMSQSELLGLLLAVLRGSGFIAIPSGASTYRVMPDDTAAQQARSAGGDAGFFTRIFPLRSVDARVAAETLKPLIGRGGVIMATPQGNSVLVADYADNLRRIATLIAQIDHNNSTIDTVTLRNSSARDIAATVRNLFGIRASDGSAAMLSILPVESSNSIVLRGDPTQIQRVVQTILELDRRAESQGDVSVVKLQHANAEQLLPVLQQLVGQPVTASTAETTAGTASPDGVATSAAASLVGSVPGRRATIVRYPGSNSLVINADPDTRRTLLEVIRQLDTRRQQVLVEAIVVEISDEAAKKLGVQLMLAGREGSKIPFVATQFPSSSPGIVSLAGAAAAGDDESSDVSLARRAAVQSLLGLSGGLAGLAGQNDNALFGLIINAVKSDTASNLLSTPSIMTLDNEAARILVGQEIPVTTGEVLGNANSNPFRTIQRQNVGVQLEVKPQITSGGSITLQLRQEVSSIAGPVSSDFNELILNKREIETRVLVDDGAIVVLGGLLDQNDRKTVDKIPLLGDIPVVGGLFRSTARTRARTNLMVFIRPTIIRDAAEAQRETAPRYEYIRDQQLRNDRTSEAALDELVREYLRASPPVAPNRGAAARDLPVKPAAEAVRLP